ncbi:hypothetical protein ACFV16_24705, partial [Streptomyces massasporeus]
TPPRLPAPPPHRVHIALGAPDYGAPTSPLTYEVKDDDQVYVRASTVIVPFDFEAQRPRRITAEEREFLREYMDDAEEEAVAA